MGLELSSNVESPKKGRRTRKYWEYSLMAEGMEWGALGNAQQGRIAGVGFWVDEEQVMAPVVGVREVRKK